ncbi:hypothetical protein H8R17_31375 [Streptomyces sp. TRM68367]|nr:hypothetical protein [Streptomyces sp. TRM68367]
MHPEGTASGADGPVGPDRAVSGHNSFSGHGSGSESGAPAGHSSFPESGSAAGHGSATGRVLDGARLEALLAASLRVDGVDAEGERRAVAAFRAAREAGAHRARTRRRDDWRPREQRRAGRPVKVTFSVVFASLTLGGVAVAAIGVGDSSPDRSGEGGGGRPQVSATAPGASAGNSSAPQSGPGSAAADRPGTARDTEAHCRAYEKVEKRGRALDGTAWQRLVKEAGGAANVPAYCAEQLDRATDGPAKPAKPSNPDNSGGSSSSGGTEKGSSGSRGSAGDTGDTGNSDNTVGSGGTVSGSGQGQSSRANGKTR